MIIIFFLQKLKDLEKKSNYLIFNRGLENAASISSLLSTIKWNEQNTSVVSAAAYMTTWVLNISANDSIKDEGGLYVHPIAEAWEDRFIALLVNTTGYEVFYAFHYYVLNNHIK